MLYFLSLISIENMYFKISRVSYYFCMMTKFIFEIVLDKAQIFTFT